MASHGNGISCIGGGEIAVLLTDDDSAHRLLARRALLKDFPWLKIVEADSAGSARAFLLNDEYKLDLAILDLRLASESGLEVLKSIRAAVFRSQLPVIMLSTSGMAEDMHSSYANGANCYMIKAPDPDKFQLELSSAVRFFLRASLPAGSIDI